MAGYTECPHAGCPALTCQIRVIYADLCIISFVIVYLQYIVHLFHVNVGVRPLIIALFISRMIEIVLHSGKGHCGFLRETQNLIPC